MVDVSAKAETDRKAIASGVVRMLPATLNEILDKGLAKGDVLAVARVAGIQAAKRCADLIPLCHPLALNKVSVLPTRMSKLSHSQPWTNNPSR